MSSSRITQKLVGELMNVFIVSVLNFCTDDDDELMLNVLRCHLTY